ncbi:hypothetical protein [uncultured Polaribacter sp.]|uniref:hypothetical protein n=1 Tax=uncultured Polaribacter sp. TaxID=174711 RepID=UPI002611AB2E|nr:hypothetical protein [uncultured Polaribacter sp.]
MFVILILYSCDKFTSSSKNKNLKGLDTVVDFTSVDFSPSFKVCDSIINKTKKSDCFRNTIHQKIGEELQKHSLTATGSIDETVFVNLLINSKGEIILEETLLSKNIQVQVPKLDSILNVCIKKIPVIYPAIKRGIPVTTKYSLPIRIQLKE